MVSTTRVRFSWAALMTLVIFELVQPLQPTVVVPSPFRFWRLPAASMPTPKKAIVEIFAKSSGVELSLSSQ